jgi:hypothetical protein
LEIWKIIFKTLVMKNYLFSAMVLLGLCVSSFAQTNNKKYPDPEFANEVSFLKKDSTLIRLEKGSSSMDTKMKMGGFGGAESGYTLDGEKSPVRIAEGKTLSFIYSTGSSSSSASRDSMMKAQGVDPAMYAGAGGVNDPATIISLYKVELSKGKRKILLQKSPGMGLGSKKMQGTDKYTFSVRKIRDGYWELVVDKPLPKGEYAFSMMDMTGGGGYMNVLLFAFGVDE